MAKIIDEGLFPPDHPVYKQGWSSYIGPLQVPRERPSKNRPEDPSEKAAVENPAAEAEKTEE
jgi:hypothetical protein